MQMLQDVIEMCCLDPEFRSRLQADPKGVLREIGYEISDEIKVVINEDTSDTLHLTLPVDPWFEMPSEQEIDRTVTPPGMSVCSKSNSCCCGFGDPIEDEDTLIAA